MQVAHIVTTELKRAKSLRLRLMESVTRLLETRNAYRFFVVNLAVRDCFGNGNGRL
jgi:hypothetical protein